MFKYILGVVAVLALSTGSLFAQPTTVPVLPLNQHPSTPHVHPGQVGQTHPAHGNFPFPRGGFGFPRGGFGFAPSFGYGAYAAPSFGYSAYAAPQFVQSYAPAPVQIIQTVPVQSYSSFQTFAAAPVYSNVGAYSSFGVAPVFVTRPPRGFFFQGRRFGFGFSR